MYMNHGNDENQTQNPLIPGQKHNSFRYKYQYGQKSFGFSSENQGFLSSCLIIEYHRKNINVYTSEKN